MKKKLIPGKKLSFLLIVIIMYLIIGGVLFSLAKAGIITKLVKEPEVSQANDYDFNDSGLEVVRRTDAAKNFVDSKLREENGHIDLYYRGEGKMEESDNFTNSEAVSYYLLWNVQDFNKVAFDEELDFIEENMVHPQGNFLMWKLDSNDEVVDDGANIATDADLRAIRALFLAKEIWGDERYQNLIDKFSGALENVAITSDSHFAPYGGIRENETWKTEEVWLSYSDFNSFAFLADKKKQPWRDVYYTTKESTLGAQDGNGLYFTQIEENRQYSSRLDNGKYSINTLWIMVSNAESNDEELRASAKTALQFYKDKYAQDGIVFTEYNKDGTPASGGDSPWAYALVGRAAIMLGDEKFADSMIYELLKKQDMDESSEFYGAFVEGSAADKRAGQFTNQESIITLQQYIAMKSSRDRMPGL